MHKILPEEVVSLILSFLTCGYCKSYFVDNNGQCRACEARMLSGMC